MALNKLHKKDFSIAVKTGTESNKSKFAKECVQGEMYFATDSKKIYVANADAGTLDASLSELSTAGQFDPSYELSQLGYSGGLFSSTNYNISTQPIMHFDAAILDGSDQANNPSTGLAVSTWGDRSGQAVNYDASQVTGSAQPTFNVSGDDKYVSFDGGDVLLLSNAYNRTSGQPWTIVMVGNGDTTSSNYYAAPNEDGGGSIQLGYYGPLEDIYPGPFVNNVDLTSLNMLTYSRDGSNSLKAHRDGSTLLGSRTQGTTFVHEGIGRSGTTYTTGRIYECILFDQILSTTDLNTINSYLSNKYSGLPSLSTWS